MTGNSAIMLEPQPLQRDRNCTGLLSLSSPFSYTSVGVAGARERRQGRGNAGTTVCFADGDEQSASPLVLMLSAMYRWWVFCKSLVFLESFTSLGFLVAWGVDELGLVLSTSQVLGSRAVDLERCWRHFTSSWFSSVKSICIGAERFGSLRSDLVDIAHVSAMMSN